MITLGTFAGIDYICIHQIEGKSQVRYMDCNIVTEKMVQHFIKCVDYHQLKKILIQIDYTIITHCRRKFEIVQNRFLYSCIHILVFKSQLTKK